MKGLFWVVLVLAASLASTSNSVANDLLRVDGRAVKWAPRALGLATVITYATLLRPFPLPDTKKTLSPDNCNAMGSFDEIVANSPNLTAAAARQQLRTAFASWEKVAGVTFIEIEDVERANIVVGASAASNGRAFANLSLTGEFGVELLAKALGASSGNMAEGATRTSRRNQASTIDQAYVCLNPKQPWKIGFDGNLDVYDLRHTFMHEIGHAIGLDHPGRTGAVMGYRYDEMVGELQPSDITAARLLYGPPSAK